MTAWISNQAVGSLLHRTALRTDIRPGGSKRTWVTLLVILLITKKPLMKTSNRPLTRNGTAHASQAPAWTHALGWILLVVAGLLLVGFTAVVDDITQRGELRRVHQRVSGALMLPDEMPTQGIDTMRLLSLTSDKLVGR